MAAEVRAQLQQIERIYGLVDEREAIGGVAGMESMAYQLHNLYGAIEDLFKVVANAFENHVAPGGGYHTELLRRMTISVPDVRPRVISSETCRLLDSLRGFRHVFRHAYARELDVRKLRIVLDDARAVRGPLANDVEGFLASVEVTE
ncbi:MAG: hypothetical protein OXC31_13045 [Spirochaetaceae bacterium]|nr:hypothetical protein [Spirochaetaceae bacterium]